MQLLLSAVRTKAVVAMCIVTALIYADPLSPAFAAIPTQDLYVLNKVSVLAIAPSIAAVNSMQPSQQSAVTFANPTGITVRADGNLVVSDAWSHAVFAIDLTSGEQTTVSSSGLLRDPVGITLDPFDKIFVSQPNAGSVVAVDPADGSQTTIASGPLLDSPRSIARLSNGDLVVAGNRNLVRINPMNGQITPIATVPGSGATRIQGMAIRGAEAVVLTRSPVQLISIQLGDGSVVAMLMDTLSCPDGGLTAAPTGDLYLYDTSGVSTIAEGTGLCADVGVPAQSLASVAVTSVGNLVVGDRGGANPSAFQEFQPRISEWDSMLVVYRVVSGGAKFIDGQDIVILPDKDLLVADATIGMIRVDAVSGAASLVKSVDGFFQGPCSLDIESSGMVIVLDCDTDSVVRIDPTSGASSFLASGGHLGLSAAVTVGPDGSVYVAQIPNAAKPTIVRIDPATGAQTAVSSHYFGVVNGLTTYPGGDLLVNAGGELWRLGPASATPTLLTNNGLLGNLEDVDLDSVGQPVVARFGGLFSQLMKLQPGETELSLYAQSNLFVDPVALPEPQAGAMQLVVVIVSSTLVEVGRRRRLVFSRVGLTASQFSKRLD